MAIVTYRSVDHIGGDVFYCCIHAYAAGRHTPKPGPADPEAPLILCEACIQILHKVDDVLFHDTEPPAELESKNKNHKSLMSEKLAGTRKK